MADEPTTPPVVPFATDATARAKIALVIIKSVGSSITGVLMGVNWEDMSHQQQFLAIIAIIVNACVALEALYDKTMSSRAAGKAAGGTGRTAAPFAPRTATSEAPAGG